MLPLLAIIPLFALGFGDRLMGVTLFVALSVFVTVFAIFANAIGSVPHYFEEYARSLGASRVRSYLTVIVPAALPTAKTAFTLALGLGWSAVIAAELLGQQKGLGTVAVYAQSYGNTALLAVVAFVTVLYAAASYTLLLRALTLFTRWAD
jgi:ABC-type nitrate/sulfonate/bicarbonate transport system permease component